MITTGTYKSYDYTLIIPARIEHSLLWLHGYKERADRILARSHLVELAEQYHTAIVLPDVPDCYYLNQPWNNLYIEDYLRKELLPYLQTEHRLFTVPATSSIGGISMGGFGSLLLGSRSNLFSKIIVISGAFILDDITNGNPEIVGYDNVDHFQRLFGDFATLRTSYERNPVLAATAALKSARLPSLFLACGTEDLLYPRNRAVYRTLTEIGADITWFEAAGNHEWEFFNLAIAAAFQ